MSLLCQRLVQSLWLAPPSIRTLTTAAVSRRIPAPTPTISTPTDFLKGIGRSLDTKITVDDWAEFWQTDGPALKKMGVAIRDRRYALWCMSKYRRGFGFEEFAHEPKPKKTIRGWGPKIVDGKKNRSKRYKHKK